MSSTQYLQEAVPVTAVYLSMFVIVMLALAVGAVVLVGMRGMYSDKAPLLADRLAVAARHMNGDAPAPQKLVDLLPHGAGREMANSNR